MPSLPYLLSLPMYPADRLEPVRTGQEASLYRLTQTPLTKP